jgi:hypothetical protein
MNNCRNSPPPFTTVHCQRTKKCPRPMRILAVDGKILSDHAILKPCGHVYCGRCLSQKLSQREATLVCEVCNKKVVAHEYIDRDGMNRCDHLLLDPDPHLDPFQYFVQDHSKNGNEAEARLSLCYARGGDPVILTAGFDLQKGPQGRHNTHIFLKILAKLHPSIMYGSVTEELPLQRLTPPDVCRYAVYEDRRFLSKAVFALGTGMECPDHNKLGTNLVYQSIFLACFCATEMLAKINGKGAQKLQMMIANQLRLSNASDDTWKMFARMQLAADKRNFETSSLSMRLDYLFQQVEEKEEEESSSRLTLKVERVEKV